MLYVCVQGSTYWINAASAVTDSFLVRVGSWNDEAGSKNSGNAVHDWSNANDGGNVVLDLSNADGVVVASISSWNCMAGTRCVEAGWEDSSWNHSSSDTCTARDGGGLVEPLDGVTGDNRTWLWLTCVSWTAEAVDDVSHEAIAREDVLDGNHLARLETVTG